MAVSYVAAGKSAIMDAGNVIQSQNFSNSSGNITKYTIQKREIAASGTFALDFAGITAAKIVSIKGQDGGTTTPRYVNVKFASGGTTQTTAVRCTDIILTLNSSSDLTGVVVETQAGMTTDVEYTVGG